VDPIQPFNSDANGKPIKNLYAFPDSDSRLVTRLRRVEKTVPYLNAGEPVFTSSSAQGVDPNILTSAGAIDIASSNVQKIGGVSPNGVTGQFAAVTTGTTITWYWDGTNGSTPLVIHRADSSTFVVPRGSIQITGLANSTTYYFLPFWNTTGGCQVSWVIGTHGAPQIAFVVADTTDPANAQFYLAQQTLQNREPLAGGFMTQATTSGGTGGGGAGGGGGGGNCVMSGTSIDPIGDYGEMTVGIHHEKNWTRLITAGQKVLYCTNNHNVYGCEPEEVNEMTRAMLDGITEENLERYKIISSDLSAGCFVITETGPDELIEVTPIIRVCTKRSVHMNQGHLYWANGILSHNQKIFG
jgi:hypothetical protein